MALSEWFCVLLRRKEVSFVILLVKLGLAQLAG